MEPRMGNHLSLYIYIYVIYILYYIILYYIIYILMCILMYIICIYILYYYIYMYWVIPQNQPCQFQWVILHYTVCLTGEYGKFEYVEFCSMGSTKTRCFSSHCRSVVTDITESVKKSSRKIQSFQPHMLNGAGIFTYIYPRNGPVI